MIISKEQFEDAIKLYRDFNNYLTSLSDFYINIWEAPEVGYFEDMYTNLLSALIGEEHKADFMYFICDMNCGDNDDEDVTWLEDKNGNKVHIHNASDFYDFINEDYSNLDIE